MLFAGARLAELGAMLLDVFERFTDRARRVLVLAQEDARLLKHNFIGTEHTLLGLVREGEGVAAKALGSLSITHEAVWEKVEETIGPAGSSTTGSPPFTPRAKKVLELSLREALQLGHNYIGTEHLLLGLAREGEGVAIQVLASLGADPSRVRRQVIALLDGLPSPDVSDPQTTSETELLGGPRCPGCRSLLKDQVGYRVLPVRPVETGDEFEPISVIFVYCLRCGAVVAHAPAGDIGGHRQSGVSNLSPQVGPGPAGHDEERVVAEGATDGKMTLRAGGDDESYSTTLRIEDQSGVISSGGMGGPKLWNEDLLNVYTTQTAHGRLAVVLRTDPSIVRAVLVARSGAQQDLDPCGEAPIDDLRFYIGFASPGKVLEVRGLDAEGIVRETYDLTFWNTMPRS